MEKVGDFARLVSSLCLLLGFAALAACGGDDDPVASDGGTIADANTQPTQDAFPGDADGGVTALDGSTDTTLVSDTMMLGDTNQAADPTSCSAFPKSALTLMEATRRSIRFCDDVTISQENRCFLTSTCNGFALRFVIQGGARGVSGSVEPRLDITSTSHGTLTNGVGILADSVSDLPEATDITLGLMTHLKTGSVTLRFDGDTVTVKSYQQPR